MLYSSSRHLLFLYVMLRKYERPRRSVVLSVCVDNKGREYAEVFFRRESLRGNLIFLKKTGFPLSRRRQQKYCIELSVAQSHAFFDVVKIDGGAHKLSALTNFDHIAQFVSGKNSFHFLCYGVGIVANNDDRNIQHL